MTDDEREQEERAYVRAVLGQRPEPIQLPDPDERPAPRQGNHVPREGNGNGQARPADYGERDFVGELFGANPNARNLDDPNEYEHRTEHL